MRILVTLIIDTIPMLGNVVALGFLIFTIFGVIGVQLWKGTLRNRCFLNDTKTSFYSPEEIDFVCTMSSGMTSCKDVPVSINHMNYTECRHSDVNPFKNSISFDNIGYAFIVIFQIITLESWVTIMQRVQDANSQWVWVYFVLVIVVIIISLF
jgi:hypothetical protein